MKRVTATVCWASLIARDTDITPEHENTMVEVVGTYTPGRKATRVDPEDPAVFEAETIYVLPSNGLVKLELTESESEKIDWGRAREALEDASRTY
jgi:hypothetical protein